MADFETGTLTGTGTFRCLSCDYGLTLSASDELPTCPSCGGREFQRASLFTGLRADSETTGTFERIDSPAVEQAGHDIGEDGQYLLFEGPDGLPRTHPISREWTRVGRSLGADIRFDDPTVSRRHALLLRVEGGGIRLLDDRSLNGVFVNGERVEWADLHDGDEILVGRHQLRFRDVPVVSGMREGAREVGEVHPSRAG